MVVWEPRRWQLLRRLRWFWWSWLRWRLAARLGLRGVRATGTVVFFVGRDRVVCRCVEQRSS